MNKDTIILALLTGIGIISVAITNFANRGIPSVLETAVTTLVGATAGVAVSGRNVVAPTVVPNANLG